MAVELSTIARPYAEAIFQRARETEKLDPWSDMLAFLGAVVADRDMAAMITNPKLGKEQLVKLLLEVCGERVDDEGVNLIRLLTANDRLAAAPAISALYEQLKQEARGVIEVTLTSAYAMQAADKKAIGEALKARLGKEVNITAERDPSLIGGVRIRAGDLVIDGSIQGRLRQLATEIGI